MAEQIIRVKELKKVFKVREKSKEGLWAAVSSLLKGNYRFVTAVDGLNMDIERGEIRGLIGPNGAGKSTTIKMISGILYPSEGTVDVMGFTPWRQREEYVRHIGVVFGQKTQLFWDLPPGDTFLLQKDMYRIPEKRYRENIAYFTELLQLETIIKRPVRNLSLGERMKCELVCAVLHEPELVYLDEPTIGLDLFAKESIRNYIKRINREKGITFILTTHDLDEIENLCGKISIINHGTLVYDGPLHDLRGLFSRRKMIEVRYPGEVPDPVLSGLNVISARPGFLKIELDVDRQDIREEVSRLFQLLPVQDINIESIGIEEVIKQIYNRQYP
jgi:ABC-2 type transport system ATP-binding protein